jgi:hypothetical protein
MVHAAPLRTHDRRANLGACSPGNSVVERAIVVLGRRAARCAQRKLLNGGRQALSAPGAMLSAEMAGPTRGKKVALFHAFELWGCNRSHIRADTAQHAVGAGVMMLTRGLGGVVARAQAEAVLEVDVCDEALEAWVASGRRVERNASWIARTVVRIDNLRQALVVEIFAIDSGIVAFRILTGLRSWVADPRGTTGLAIHTLRGASASGSARRPARSGRAPGIWAAARGRRAR